MTTCWTRENDAAKENSLVRTLFFLIRYGIKRVQNGQFFSVAQYNNDAVPRRRFSFLSGTFKVNFCGHYAGKPKEMILLTDAARDV